MTPAASATTATTATTTPPATSSVVSVPAPRGLHGRIRVPGDKSISHRAILLAARAEGVSALRGVSTGDDVARTLAAVAAFGAAVEGTAPGQVLITGGPERLTEPAHVIDVGNSGTAIRLLAGWSAAIDGLTVLQGDESIARRPMDRVAEPLRAMGATVDGRQGGRYAPLVIRGGELTGIDIRPAVASAQVKTAILLAGLAASGPTTVRETVPTRAHTEELLRACGADIVVSPGAVTVRRSTLTPLDLDVPADPSQAAFWVVAACIVPGSDIVVEHVYVGPGRAGFVAVLQRMGADVTLEDHDATAHTADIRVRHAGLRATDVGGDEVPSLIDEIPVLAVAAAMAEGTTTFAGAAELRVKESDRIATVTSELTAIGGRVTGRPDGLVITGSGGAPLVGGDVTSHGDHRIAMAMAIAGLAAAAPVHVAGWDAVATSYPNFEEDLRRCVS